MDLLLWVLTVLTGIVTALVGWGLKEGIAFRRELTEQLAAFRLEVTGTYVREADCDKSQAKCLEHMRETIRDPICRKIDEIRKDRVEKWNTHAKEIEGVWVTLNSHSHTGLPDNSKVIR